MGAGACKRSKRRPGDADRGTTRCAARAPLRDDEAAPGRVADREQDRQRTDDKPLFREDSPHDQQLAQGRPGATGPGLEKRRNMNANNKEINNNDVLDAIIEQYASSSPGPSREA